MMDCVEYVGKKGVSAELEANGDEWKKIDIIALTK